jgi:SM-20-related protein
MVQPVQEFYVAIPDPEVSMSVSVINFDALSSAELCTDPYPYASYDKAFHEPESLTSTFPTSGFEWHSQRKLLETLGRKGSDAWYQHSVATRPLLELGSTEPHEPSELDEVWLALAEDLLSDAYRENLSALTGRDVRSLPMQAHFWRFEPGSHFQPHVDKPHKIVTQLLYLTEDWSAEMGGCFRILGSDDPEDVLEEVPPLPNNSLVLSRTDNAWHSVSAIPRDTDRSRRLVQIWFWGD